MEPSRSIFLSWAGLVGLLLTSASQAAAQPARSEWQISKTFEVAARNTPTSGVDCRSEAGDGDEADGERKTGQETKQCSIDLGDPNAYLLRPPGRRGDRELVVRIDGLTSGRKGHCQEVNARFTLRFPEGRQDASLAEAAASRHPMVEATVDVASIPEDESSVPTFVDTVDATVPTGWRTVRPDISAGVDADALLITVRRLDLDDELPSVAESLIERFVNHLEVREHLACLDLEPEKADGNENPPGVATRERIQRAVAEALPRTFEDALELAYGVSSTRRHVNLEPGMRLCVSSVESLKRTGNGVQTLVRQGPRQCIPVGWRHSADGAVTVFEPLLSRFGTLRIGQSGTGVRRIADGADLSDPSSARRYFRIFYPTVLHREKAVFPAGATSALLVGVDSKATLDIATAHGYENLSAFCSGTPADAPDGSGAAPVCYRFAEQAVPIPEILVEIQGEPAWVPIGTTLFDVLARAGIPDLLEFSAIDGGEVAHRRTRKMLEHVELERRFGFAMRDVRFSGIGTGALHLPLVQGDRVQW